MNFPDENRLPVEPYPELREVLHAFAGQVISGLGDNLTGLYMVGSLASGDFDSDSDVDFLAVTKGKLDKAGRIELQRIHTDIQKLGSYPAHHLEGSYISLKDLNDQETVGKKPLFYFDNGSITPEWSVHDNQWHVRWILRERGLTLFGVKPGSLMPAVPLQALLDEVRTAMHDHREIFKNEMDGPLSFCNSRFGQPHFVLTYCRMLQTLSTGTVQSKKAGMEWARKVVDNRWVLLIDQAWEERKGVRYGIKIGQRAESERLTETLEFIDYAISQIDRLEMQGANR
jgi:hypothetical protein